MHHEYRIKKRPPGSMTWRLERPITSRRVALYRQSELRRAGYEVEIESYPAPPPPGEYRRRVTAALTVMALLLAGFVALIVIFEWMGG